MTDYRIYIEPVARQRLFQIELNLPREIDIVWEWDVRGAEDTSKIPKTSPMDSFTTASLAHGFAASEEEAHKEAQKWADALSRKSTYIYTAKRK